MPIKKLSDYAYNVYSQFGEDGIIEKIFNILGTSSKICIEFGAWDGFHLSNTANLWNKGWKAILIESDDEKYLSLVENVKGYDVRCIKAFVSYKGHNTIENILRREGVSDDIDFLSIDIDGDDYYVFESLKELRHRVIAIEYNPTIPVHMDLIAEKGNYFGCSALSLVKLAERKGYRLIAMTDTNCFFVKSSDFNMFESYEVDLELIAPTRHLSYFITGYGGDFILSNKPTYGATRPSTQKLRGECYVFSDQSFFGACPSFKRKRFRKRDKIKLLTFLSKTLLRIANLCRHISERLYVSPQSKRVLPWREIQGDKTLRLDYDLNENSVVFDLGGYEGQWSSDIFSKYCCFIHCFEPVEVFANNIENRFSKNPKINVHQFGLSKANKKTKISFDKDSSSIFRGEAKEEIQLVKATDFMEENNILKIDLMKINIEGGEYDLLEHLIETGFVKKIFDLQIQFHDFIPNARGRMENIQKKLKKTHKLSYQYEFVWESWKLK